MAAPKTPEGYLSISEAAKLVGVSRVTMYDWVITRRLLPHEDFGRYHYIKKQDVDELHARLDDRPGRKRITVYEIVVISCGELTVLYTTGSLRALSLMYTHMMERQHRLVRVRADGKLLTIHESDKVGYAFHPRTRKGASA